GTSVISNLLPEKSRRQYENAFQQFKERCKANKARKISENVLLAYFAEKSKVEVFHVMGNIIIIMLKSTLNVKKEIYQVGSIFEKLSVGNHPKKYKVVLILGISGACRRDELTKMTVDNRREKDSILIVKVPHTKTNIQRIFTVSNLDYIDIYRKYAALCPSYATSRRLFFKCFNQVVGINCIGKMPSLIAKYLKLPNFDAYTGHCFRRTSATLLANAGGNICSLKRHEGWKSSTVAEGYMEDSINNKIQISNKILDCEISGSSAITFTAIASTSKTDSFPTATPISRTESDLSGLGINIGSCTGCTINRAAEERDAANKFTTEQNKDIGMRQTNCFFAPAIAPD
ncbi:hypothetical protein NQ317_016080, partial [Molorchus minor]